MTDTTDHRRHPLDVALGDYVGPATREDILQELRRRQGSRLIVALFAGDDARVAQDGLILPLDENGFMTDPSSAASFTLCEDSGRMSELNPRTQKIEPKPKPIPGESRLDVSVSDSESVSRFENGFVITKGPEEEIGLVFG